ncbi:MAG: CDP-alcohol phosphatidyltransferase family protein [Pikeienuella sp.]
MTLSAYIHGDSAHVVFGLSPAERLKRQLPKVGVAVVDTAEGASMVLSGNCVYGASVLKALASAAPGAVLKDEDGRVAGVKGDDASLIDGPSPAHAKTGAEMAGRYDKVLRKRADPMVSRLGAVKAVEQEIFDATYKGVTDFVTKHVWPRPALAAVRFCVRHGFSPNQVTYASAVLVFVTLWLFWIGAFLPGLVTAYMMTFLDTVDGKLARATLTSSKMGDVLDHGIDLIHPPFWWWAWWVGLIAAGEGVAFFWLGAILFGYIAQRVLEGLFIWRFGIEMHIWRPFDSFFRKITARRNPNLVILTVFTLLGMPAEGFIAVAFWVIIGLLVHAWQIVEAYRATQTGPIGSWMED